jgi:5-methylthioadenosine/S-adenosylhomocysteine deaminase
MEAAALVHKGTSLDPTVVPALAVVRMATLDGAEALGLGDQIGAIDGGRRADLIQVRLDAPHLIPRYDIFSHLVYSAKAEDVDTVVGEGKIRMHQRRLLTLDEAAMRSEVTRMSDRIRVWTQRASERVSDAACAALPALATRPLDSSGAG